MKTGLEFSLQVVFFPTNKLKLELKLRHAATRQLVLCILNMRDGGIFKTGIGLLRALPTPKIV